MYRNFYNELRQWEANPKRKPLLVIGARQVGKTYIIDEFCQENYQDCFYINLEKQREYLSVFDEDLDPKGIIRRMEQLSGRRIQKDCTIFIDEIQQSDKAITSLKYFCEAKEDYRIIGAGSLLGVKLSRFEGSFPVGNVSVKNMYPMNFEEFLIACDEVLLMNGIEEAFQKKQALSLGIHNKALRLYHDYLFTGGMPEMVNEYLNADKNVSGIDESLYDDIRLAYMADMTKYTISPAESVKITDVYNSIPSQLARDNPKFKYKSVRTYANKRDFSTALDWLIQSALVYEVRKLTLPAKPLKGYEDQDSKKIYYSDVGLLIHAVGLGARDLMPDNHNIYKGAVIENFVVQQMASYGHNLNYYKPSESMEIDLVVDCVDGIIPVEIKSGRHKRSKSLNNYRDKYNPPYALRISEKNFGFFDGIFSLPLYAVWCFQ